MLEATKTGDNPFYMWRVSADMKKSVLNAVYLGGPSLGLGRDYYQNENEAYTKTLGEYKNSLAKLFDVLGEKNADQTAQRVVAFEKQLANYLLTNEENRDANKRYNPKTIKELSTLTTHIDLPNYLSNVGVKTDKVIVSAVSYTHLDVYKRQILLNNKQLFYEKPQYRYSCFCGNHCTCLLYTSRCV